MKSIALVPLVALVLIVMGMSLINTTDWGWDVNWKNYLAIGAGLFLLLLRWQTAPREK